MNCEAFLDFTYGESEYAMEAFHPIKGLQNLVIKLISAIQRLFNNFKKLRKITVPKDMLDRYNTIVKMLNRVSDHSVVLKKTSDGMYEANTTETEKFNQILSDIEKSDEYQVFMSADKRSETTPKAEYMECDSAKIVNSLNSSIKSLTNIKTELNKGNFSSELQASYKAVIRKYTILIKLCNKILSFRKPLKDPADNKDMQQLDPNKRVKATVYP